MKSTLLMVLAAGFAWQVWAADQVNAAGRFETRPALPPGVNPEKAGQEIADIVRSMAPARSNQVSGTLTVRRGEDEDRKLPVTATTIPRNGSWEVIYETAPANPAERERLAIVHHQDKPSTYLYSHGLASQPRTLDGHQATLPYGASDFWLADLGLEFFHWPTQRLLRFEMRSSRSCRVLESINPKPEGGYSRVVSWIDVETDGLISAEAYDRKNKLLKEFKVSGMRKVEGRWELKELRIRNVQAKSTTELAFDATFEKQ